MPGTRRVRGAREQLGGGAALGEQHRQEHEVGTVRAVACRGAQQGGPVVRVQVAGACRVLGQDLDEGPGQPAPFSLPVSDRAKRSTCRDAREVQESSA